MILSSPMQKSLGIGIYSFADAARFIGAKPVELRRWMLGYNHKSKDGEQIFSKPLWKNQLSNLDVEGLGFQDLIELRFIHTFRGTGVSLNTIRRTLDVARERLSTPYPFTCQKFKTDGRTIFMQVLEETGDESLVDVLKQQNVMNKIIGPSLRAGVELDLRGSATRWFPLKNSKAIVFDPTRKFGQPILNFFDIPTAAIVESVKAESGNHQRVANLFDVPVLAIKKALEFENRTIAA